MDSSRLFAPESIAVIGASRDPNKVGSVILKNLRITYRGKLFPVNKNANEIQSIRAYSKISEIKDTVDIAIVSIPAEGVLQVLKECERKKVKFAIVISAGFKESGPDGAKLEQDIKKFLKTAKIRVIGPNCLGIINTNPSYNATFIDPNSKPLEGKTAFISQSGALLSAIMDDATLEKIGFSKIVSIGNETDISAAEMLQVLSSDEKTSAITLYLEGIENGQEFIKSALEVTKKKPIIVLKGGKSKVGATAVSSHTGALAGDNISYELAFKRAGVVSVTNIDDLFNFMRDAPYLKIKSDEVIIITNAGGGGVITTDAMSEAGLKLARLSNNTTNELMKVLPKEAAIHNPIDILGDATPERYKETLEVVSKLNKPIIIIFSPQETSMPIETAKEISEIQLQNKDLPILPVFMGGTRVEKARRFLRENGLPAYNYPNEAVDIIEGLYKYGSFSIPTYSTYDKVKFKKMTLKLKENYFGLDAKGIFDKLGIKTAYGISFKTESELEKAARTTGYPCVLKIGSNTIAHKGEVGGVIVGIKNPEELHKAFIAVKTKAAENHLKPTHYELYKDVNVSEKRHVEILLGGHRDDQFGPLVAVGLGGEYANLLKETVFLLAPLSDNDITEFKSSKIGKLLLAAAKHKVFDEIIEYTIKIAKFMESNPCIKDIDLNPIFLFDDEAIATDFKIFKENN
jgi:acetyltransferase